MNFILIFVGCISEVCRYDSAPTDIPVGTLELVANQDSPTLPKDASAQVTAQDFVVTYTDENGRTWRIT